MATGSANPESAYQYGGQANPTTVLPGGFSIPVSFGFNPFSDSGPVSDTFNPGYNLGAPASSGASTGSFDFTLPSLPSGLSQTDSNGNPVGNGPTFTVSANPGAGFLNPWIIAGILALVGFIIFEEVRHHGT